uniref:Uncharacterized protein n=1 Tax=Sipha flava TaxID=143950 RepID=A0A2S2RAP5_9HEMI
MRSASVRERARKWAGGHMRNSIERPDTDSLKAALTHNRALGQRPILGPLRAPPALRADQRPRPPQPYRALVDPVRTAACTSAVPDRAFSRPLSDRTPERRRSVRVLFVS